MYFHRLKGVCWGVAGQHGGRAESSPLGWCGDRRVPEKCGDSGERKGG